MKPTKSILSFALAALFIAGLGLAAFAFEAEADELSVQAGQSQAYVSAPGENVTKYPVVFGAGAWHYLYENEEPVLPASMVPDTKQKTVFDPGAMLGSGGEGLGTALDAILALDMDAFGDSLIQMWNNAYGNVPMDSSGECIAGNISSYTPFLAWLGTKYFIQLPEEHALNETMRAVKKGGYLAENQAFWNFDWRLDSWVNAEKLHDFIVRMIDTYGQGNSHPDGNHNGYYGEPFDKVNFNAISGSGPIGLAYLKRYGTKNLASLVFNISMHGGSSLFGNIALGGFGFDAASLANGGLSMFGLQDGKVDQNPFGLSPMTMSVLYQSGFLGGLLKGFNYAARGAYTRFYEDAIIPLWFHVPTYWAMVPPDKYEAAKAFLLKGDPKYNGLLEKTDRYQYEILAFEEQLILDAASKIKLSVRVGYGPPLSPYAIGANVSSDKLVDTYYASLGATCAEPGRPFPTRYKQAVPGSRNYVSADRLVDASTCLLPDVTWFAKDLPHTAQWDYSGWYGWWLAAENYTVWDNDDYPQYSQWSPKDEDKGEISDHFTPLVVEPTTTLDILMEFALRLLAAWRWLLLLPLFWM